MGPLSCMRIPCWPKHLCTALYCPHERHLILQRSVKTWHCAHAWVGDRQLTESLCGLRWPLGLPEWVVSEDTLGSTPWNWHCSGSQLKEKGVFPVQGLDCQWSLHPHVRNVALKFLWGPSNRDPFSLAWRLNLQIYAGGMSHFPRGMGWEKDPTFQIALMWVHRLSTHLVLGPCASWNKSVGSLFSPLPTLMWAFLGLLNQLFFMD